MEEPAQVVSTESLERFVEEVLRTGLMLTDLVGTLADGLPDDAYPGENSVEVLVEMIAGTIAPAVDAAGYFAVRDASAMMAAIRDVTLRDLHAAANQTPEE